MWLGANCPQLPLQFTASVREQWTPRVLVRALQLSPVSSEDFSSPTSSRLALVTGYSLPQWWYSYRLFRLFARREERHANQDSD